MQRMVVWEMLLHCQCRTTGIGVLPVDLLLQHVLPKITVLVKS